jgi:hypothetical protein
VQISLLPRTIDGMTKDLLLVGISRLTLSLAAKTTGFMA